MEETFRYLQNGLQCFHETLIKLIKFPKKHLGTPKLEAWSIFTCARCKFTMPLIIYWPRYQALLFFNFMAWHKVQSYTGDTIDKWNWFARSSTWLRAFSENEFWSENYTSTRNQTDDFIAFIRLQLYMTYRIPGGMYSLLSTNHIRMVKNVRTNILSSNFMNFLHGVLFQFW